MRPVPSILPTLRLIDSGMLPTLGYLLNLTDDQKTKAQDLLSKTDEELKPKIAAQVKAASDYVALLGNPNSSQADLIAAAQKVLTADSDLMAGRIKAFVAFKALLTPEQNKLLAQELQTTASRWLPQAQTPAGPAAAPAASK
jgi:Spy/CpxP family protein refolding chaperone